jgi:eukaryotic-like serine/threonine-protein kinase
LGQARNESKGGDKEALARAAGLYKGAEPLLLGGYEGMKKRANAVSPDGRPRLPQAVDRIVELYTATSRPDELKKWQAERATYPEVKDSAGVTKK